MEGWVQIVVTIAGVLGSASIWKFFEARMKVKAEERAEEARNDDGIQYRDDLKDRVRNLEALLAKALDKEDELNKKILELTAQVAELGVKVEFLERENERLKNK
jgi:phage shock protein A